MGRAGSPRLCLHQYNTPHPSPTVWAWLSRPSQPLGWARQNCWARLRYALMPSDQPCCAVLAKALILTEAARCVGSYRYYLTVVPTTFISAISSRTRTFLYSVTEYFTPGSAHGSIEDINVEKMPAVEFRIRMSPLATKVWYPQRQIGHFTTRLCAVLGGCVALTQCLHTLVHAVMT